MVKSEDLELPTESNVITELGELQRQALESAKGDTIIPTEVEWFELFQRGVEALESLVESAEEKEFAPRLDRV